MKKEMPEAVIKLIKDYNCGQKQKTNIFNIIGLNSDDEAKLHTPFIAYLLDAYGAHGMGDAFLKHFMKIVFGNDNDNSQISKSRTFTELTIGPVTEYSGGRIDILVEFEYKAIIIENKLNAADQKNQLTRYKSFGDSRYHNRGYKIIYLTLNGHKAKDICEDAYICISYKKHIIEWLNECLKCAPNDVKYLISNYKELVEQLTSQSAEEKILEKIEKHGVSKNDLFNHYFFDNLCKRLEVINCELEADKNNGYQNHLQQWFTFYVKPKKYENPKISFQFQSKDAQDLVFGINKGDSDEEMNKKLHDDFARYDNKKKNWICSNHFDKYRHWGAKEYLMMTDYNSDLFKYIETLIEELLIATKCDNSK